MADNPLITVLAWLSILVCGVGPWIALIWWRIRRHRRAVAHQAYVGSLDPDHPEAVRYRREAAAIAEAERAQHALALKHAGSVAAGLIKPPGQ